MRSGGRAAMRRCSPDMVRRSRTGPLTARRSTGGTAFASGRSSANWQRGRRLAAIFPRVKTLNVFLAYSEILGFLMYLEDTGRVEKIVSETRDRYRLVPAALL